MLRNTSLPLDYLSASPVRGQLEPHDPKTPLDWRWLQTTETLDQFRVLLPPRTAQAYAHLLACEAAELAKEGPSWEKILEIRHLKDRMVRKTQRLSPNLPPKRLNRGETFTFQTVIAPIDFRLKEMERWLQEQSILPAKKLPPVSTSHSLAHSRKSSFCCDTCTPPPNAGQSLRRTPSSMSRAADEAALPIKLTLSNHLPNILEIKGVESPQSASPYADRSRSPSPLPLRIRNSLGLAPSSPPPEDSDSSSTSPVFPDTLARKRSILKRSSANDILKTVSWADNSKDLVNQIVNASSDGVIPEGSKLNSIQSTYQDQITSLEELQSTVQTNLTQLRLEVSRLEDVECTLSEQKSLLSSTFEAFEQKRLVFRDQVQQALEEDFLSFPPSNTNPEVDS